MKHKPRFLNDHEKLQHYSEVAGVDLSSYKCETTLKIYVGADFLIYKYNHAGELEVLSSILVVDMAIGDKGLKVTMIDKQKYNLFVVYDVPAHLGGYNLMAHLPYRCFIERTVKHTVRGNLIYGLTGGVLCYMQSDPTTETPGHTYIVPQHQAADVLGYDKLTKALNEITV